MFSKGNNTNISYQITANRAMSWSGDDDITKSASRVIQRYDLNMRKRRASVTIRVRQSGHSRDEDMMRSEQLRHIAKWLQKKAFVKLSE